MAIYHLSVQIISRGKGRSAVAAAAYRAGEKLVNEYDGITHDYTKKGGVLHSEIMLPSNAPQEFSERHTLWNSVEKVEKSSNSQLAREFDIALPKELSFEQNLNLIREYCRDNFVSKGMIADFAIHNKNKGNDNIHAHIMLTTRSLKENGQWGEKEKKDYTKDENGEHIPVIDPTTGLQKVDSRNRKQWKREYVKVNDWNNRENVELWRGQWACIVNRYLERNNVKDRIDHRSYERQGIERLPTVHLGVAESQMEKRGIATERGNINRAISAINNKLRQFWNEIVSLKDRLKEAVSLNAKPTFAVLLKSAVEDGDLHKGYGRIRSLDMAASVLSFMREHGISKVSELRDKVSEIANRSSSIRDKLKIYEVQKNADMLIRDLEQSPQRTIRSRDLER